MKRLLVLLLLLGVSVAHAADVKISALTAASSANMSDEYPANQSGTTRKVTGAQIASLAITNIVTGSSGTLGPLETWQVLDANCTQTTSTTMATCMTTNSLTAGTYDFEYHVIWNGGSTATGLRLEVGTTGIFSRFRAIGWGAATLTGANSTAVSAQMNKFAFNLGVWATTASSNTSNNQVVSYSGVDTAGAHQMTIVQGSFALSNSSSSLFLQAASETSGRTIQVLQDSVLILRKLR